MIGETAKLENVKAGDNKISLNYKKTKQGYSFEIEVDNPNWINDFNDYIKLDNEHFGDEVHFKLFWNESIFYRCL